LHVAVGLPLHPLGQGAVFPSPLLAVGKTIDPQEFPVLNDIGEHGEG
jgi:hypothetical protein